jgi:hypothetical protein
MQKLLILLTVSLSFISAVSSQKYLNDKNAQLRKVESFHGVEVSGGIDVYLDQSDAPAVAVSAADDEDRDRIKTVVENGILKIYFKKPDSWLSVSWGNRQVKAYVSVKQLDILRASGGSDILIRESLNCQNLSIQLSGGADCKGKIQAQELRIAASGGSDAILEGQVNQLKVQASGGSDVKGFGLVCNIANLSASGGSDIQVSVQKEIIADASGGSDIYYKGDPAKRQVSSAGSSDIRRSN